MTFGQAVNVAIRVRRLERSRKAKVQKQLEALTDPTLLHRASQPEIIITIPRALYNKSVYSRRRDIVQ